MAKIDHLHCEVYIYMDEENNKAQSGTLPISGKLRKDNIINIALRFDGLQTNRYVTL